MVLIMKVRENKNNKQLTITIPQEVKDIKEGDYVQIIKMKQDEKNLITIKITKPTRIELKKLKRGGESYDELIQRILSNKNVK